MRFYTAWQEADIAKPNIAIDCLSCVTLGVKSFGFVFVIALAFGLLGVRSNTTTLIGARRGSGMRLIKSCFMSFVDVGI